MSAHTIIEGFVIPRNPDGNPAAVEENNSVNSNIDSKANHYDSVKNKYFRSLGMQPTTSAASKSVKQRATTVAEHGPFEKEDEEEEISPSRRRSFSQPVQIGKKDSGFSTPFSPPSAFPTASTSINIHQMLDPDENESFIPPHELLRDNSSTFIVGTARSVSLWEQKRRHMVSGIEQT